MRIVVISDTHNLHRSVKLPDGDILIHAGDFTVSYGAYDIPVIQDFNAWLGEQPHTWKVVVPGNHDRYFHHYPLVARELITNARLVQDETFEIEGLTFYASPYTPKFGSNYWAFHKERGSQLAEHWKNIPSDLDVLITHGPPHMILDHTGAFLIGGRVMYGDHAGDEMLRQAVEIKRPKIHVFGHIHPGYGQVSYGGIQFYNAAQCDDQYRIVNEPWVIDYEKTDENATGESSRERDRRPAEVNTANFEQETEAAREG